MSALDLDRVVPEGTGVLNLSVPALDDQLGAGAILLPLQAGAMFHRLCQVIDLGSITVANVHLSHGQILNRRQLRRIAKVLPHRAAVVGDYNLIGPALLPGFRDVGPREPTHVAGDVVPLRIDRCLIRGVACLEARALLREASDHRPIVVSLATASLNQVAEAASALPLGVVA